MFLECFGTHGRNVIAIEKYSCAIIVEQLLEIQNWWLANWQRGNLSFIFIHFIIHIVLWHMTNSQADKYIWSVQYGRNSELWGHLAKNVVRHHEGGKLKVWRLRTFLSFYSQSDLMRLSVRTSGILVRLFSSEQLLLFFAKRLKRLINLLGHSLGRVATPRLRTACGTRSGRRAPRRPPISSTTSRSISTRPPLATPPPPPANPTIAAPSAPPSCRRMTAAVTGSVPPALLGTGTVCSRARPGTPAAAVTASVVAARGPVPLETRTGLAWTHRQPEISRCTMSRRRRRRRRRRSAAAAVVVQLRREARLGHWLIPPFTPENNQGE